MIHSIWSSHRKLQSLAEVLIQVFLNTRKSNNKSIILHYSVCLSCTSWIFMTPTATGSKTLRCVWAGDGPQRAAYRGGGTMWAVSRTARYVKTSVFTLERIVSWNETKGVEASLVSYTVAVLKSFYAASTRVDTILVLDSVNTKLQTPERR